MSMYHRTPTHARPYIEVCINGVFLSLCYIVADDFIIVIIFVSFARSPDTFRFSHFFLFLLCLSVIFAFRFEYFEFVFLFELLFDLFSVCRRL